MSANGKAAPRPTLVTEAVAGLATFLTMSYIFLLNPSLLAKAGIDPTAAFVATLASAIVSTAAMGLYARLPYAVAPVPTVTTFFVFYVCQKMGLSWQTALGAVFVSGLFSVAATLFSIRESLIKNMPDALKVGIMFAIGGFLIANGVKLGNLLPYTDNGLNFAGLSKTPLLTREAAVTAVGFVVALALSIKQFRFRAGPLVALIAAAMLASELGIPFKQPVFNHAHAFAATGHLDLFTAFSASGAAHFWLAAFVFFVVDFYGAIGKFVGLLEVTKQELNAAESDALGKALYVDSFGTLFGSILGTSSVAVFISSAVGIVSGGRTGIAALFCAGFMLLSAVLMPFIGTIPTVINAGILIYIGVILMPWGKLSTLPVWVWSASSAMIAAAISFVTYRIDDGLLFAFGTYCVLLILRKEKWQPGASIYLVVTSGLLAASVVAQYIFV